jgi:tryptophan-rich sensory protein
MPSAKMKVFLGSLLVAFVGGFAHQFSTPRQTVAFVDVLLAVAGIFLIFLWYRFDSDERQFRRPALLNIMVVALPLFTLPYYFFRTRTPSRALLATTLLVAAAILFTALQYAGAYAAYSLNRSNLRWSGHAASSSLSMGGNR